MKRLLRTAVVIAGLIVSLAATAVFAQSEKISPRVAPKPNQIVHITMAQEMDMDISIDATGPVPAGIGPMKMTMRTTATMTQKTGLPKPDGSYDAELRYDDVRSEMAMNGQPMTTGALDQIIGKAIIVSYNRAGQVIDTNFPPGLPGASEMVKELLRSFSGNLPDTPIGIGEAISIPLDMTLPLPIPGGSGMKLDGQTEMKLVSIDRDGKGRSARFDSVMYGKMTSSLPLDPKNPMNMDFTLRGSGTTITDLDAGFVRSGESNTMFDAKIVASPGSSPAGMPPMSMKGTMKVTFAGSN